MRLAVVCLLFVLCLALAGASGWMLCRTQGLPSVTPAAIAPKGTQPLDLDHLKLGQRGTICPPATYLVIKEVIDDRILIVEPVTREQWTEAQYKAEWASSAWWWTDERAAEDPESRKRKQELLDKVHYTPKPTIAIDGVSPRGIVDGAKIRLRQKYIVSDTYTRKTLLGSDRMFLLQPCRN